MIEKIKDILLRIGMWRSDHNEGLDRSLVYSNELFQAQDVGLDNLLEQMKGYETFLLPELLL
jgi:hypothetical protein